MTDCIYNLRKDFPCGLVQPAGTYRCNVDALYLAAFAAMQQKSIAGQYGRVLRMADVGCGCGVIGLAMLLALSEGAIHCTALEKYAPLVVAAQENAERLGFAEHFEAIEQDVCNPLPACCVGVYDMVVCNPPWHVLGCGRLPNDQARVEALFADEACFLAFLNTVTALARPEGWIFLSVGAERLANLLSFAQDMGLRFMTSLEIYRPKGRGVRLHCLALQKP